MITALTVNYNTPDYLERLLVSFRKFYPDLPYLVIDGSDKDKFEPIKDFNKRFNVELLHFDYNIHHGPGMAYGIKRIQTNQILLVDSDMIIHSGGWLEMMEKELRPESYGIGDIQKERFAQSVVVSPLNRRQRHVRHAKVARKIITTDIPYLHPAFALVNKNIIMKYPLPFKGGAPLLLAMKALYDKKEGHLIQSAPYISEDLWQHTKKYVQHNDNHEGMGTVVRTDGYHLE